MKCAIMKDTELLEIGQCDTPTPKAGEVLVEVEIAGICGSDASLFRGKTGVPLPVIPGHEAVGRIAALGENVKNVSVGQRVVIHPSFSCGECQLCRSGHANICPDKVRLGLDCDGVFAEYVTIPADYAWPVPASMDSEVAVFTEPVAVAYRAFYKAAPKAGQRALVFGAGVIGLLVTQFLRNAGCRIVAVDLVPERLEIARRMGASVTLDNTDSLAENGPFDVVYETSGAPQAFALATEVAALGGSIVLLGLPPGPHPVLATPIVRKELRVFGSIVYTDEFEPVLYMLEKGLIDTKPLVSSVCNLEDLPGCLKGFSDPDRVKTLIRIGAA